MGSELNRLKDVPQAMLDLFKEDAKDNLANVKDLFYRISIKGVRYKVNGALIGDRGLEFQAIILREIPVNLWYATKYDPATPVGPDCWALGGIKPDASSPMIQSETCLTCPRNRFGSGTAQDGSKRRGKSCHNTRRLVLKVDKIDIPVLISLPPTSTKSMNFYLKTLSSGDIPIPMFGVVTQFGFDSGVEYPRPVLTQGRFLTAEEYKETREYRITQQVEDALKAYAIPDDYEGLEEADGKDIPF